MGFSPKVIGSHGRFSAGMGQVGILERIILKCKGNTFSYQMAKSFKMIIPSAGNVSAR